MHRWLLAEHDLAHQLHQRRKQQFFRVLRLGGLLEQPVQPIGIQQPLQCAPRHHTHRTIFKNGSNTRLSNILVALEDLGIVGKSRRITKSGNTSHVKRAAFKRFV